MSDEALWWLSLGAGLVVLVVASVLLHILLVSVRSVERGASAVWHAGKGVARNTAALWMLQQTPKHVDRLAEEARLHREALGRKDA